MYDVIGNVVDENVLGIQDVIVSDGKQKVKTDADGYYEIKTDSKTLTYSANGYAPNTFNLGKYKLDAKINADVTLKAVAVPLKNDNKISSFLQKNKKTLMYVGIALVVGVAGYYLYKKSKN